MPYLYRVRLASLPWVGLSLDETHPFGIARQGIAMLFHQTLPKPNASKAPPAYYRLRDVMRISALSRSTIYRRVAEGRFPAPVHLGGRASAWSSFELQAWIDDPAGYRAAMPQPESPPRYQHQQTRQSIP